MGNYKNVANYKPNSSGNTFARVVKKVTEGVTSSTTMQDDDELFVTLAVSKTYCWEATLFCRSISATGELKYAFTLPTGAIGDMSDDIIRSDSIFTTEDIVTVVPLVLPTNIMRVLHLKGRVIMSTTNGKLQLQWAQNASDANASQIEQGSSLIVWEETS